MDAKLKYNDRIEESKESGRLSQLFGAPSRLNIFSKICTNLPYTSYFLYKGIGWYVTVHAWKYWSEMDHKLIYKKKLVFGTFL